MSSVSAGHPEGNVVARMQVLAALLYLSKFSFPLLQRWANALLHELLLSYVSINTGVKTYIINKSILYTHQEAIIYTWSNTRRRSYGWYSRDGDVAFKTLFASKNMCRLFRSQGEREDTTHITHTEVTQCILKSRRKHSWETIDDPPWL